jgi:hypothetical protein
MFRKTPNRLWSVDDGLEARDRATVLRDRHRDLLIADAIHELEALRLELGGRHDEIAKGRRGNHGHNYDHNGVGRKRPAENLSGAVSFAVLSSTMKRPRPKERRSGRDRRTSPDRRELPPRPEGRRRNGGRRATDPTDA